MQEQLCAADPQGLGADIQFHLADGVGAPDVAIEKFLQEHAIDLLVKGTVVRSGVESFMLGHTAARLLPEVHCSVLGSSPSVGSGP